MNPAARSGRPDVQAVRLALLLLSHSSGFYRPLTGMVVMFAFSSRHQLVWDMSATALALTDNGLRRIRRLVLDSVSSGHSRRAYSKALDEFFAWYMALTQHS